MTRAGIEILPTGARWFAHWQDGHDCADDSSAHGESDHPTAALRALLKVAPAPLDSADLRQ